MKKLNYKSAMAILIILSFSTLVILYSISEKEKISLSPKFPLSNKLLAHYNFENGYNDSSGSGINLSFAKTKIGAYGVIGNGTRFDTVDKANLTIPAGKINLPGKYESVFLWVKLGNMTSPVTRGILFQNNGWSRRIIYDAYGNAINFIFIDDRTSPQNQNNYHTFSINMTKGIWHQIGYTMSENTIRIYIDGQERNSIVIAPYHIKPATGEWWIGRVCTGSETTACDNVYTGFMDEIYFFNRTLSWAEVKEIYSPTNYTDRESGLVGYYPFTNGNTDDFSGNFNHGRVWNNATPAEGIDGSANSAYEFDTGGKLGSVEVPVFNNIPIKNITLMAWIKSKDTDTTNFIVNHQKWLLNGTYVLSIQPDKTAAFQIMVNQGTNERLKAQTISTLEENRWYHIAGVYDGKNITIYLNGEAQNTSRNFPGINLSSIKVITIGGTNLLMNGSADEVRIYNTSLTSARINEIYQNTKPSCSNDAQCNSNEFCEKSLCTASLGLCIEKPIETSCPSTASPVCGCNDATYQNDCKRKAAGVSKARDGSCSVIPTCDEDSDCADDEECVGGICANIIRCVDHDAENDEIGIKPYHYANVSFSNGTLIDEDACDDEDLTEFYCDPFGNRVREISVSCPDGCSSGKCSDDTIDNTCDDSDNGSDENEKGTATLEADDLFSIDFTDKCLGSRTLKEFYCDDEETLKYEVIRCMSSQVCKNGACVLPNTNNTNGTGPNPPAPVCTDGVTADKCNADQSISTCAGGQWENVGKIEGQCGYNPGTPNPPPEPPNPPAPNGNLWIYTIIMIVIVLIVVTAIVIYIVIKRNNQEQNRKPHDNKEGSSTPRMPPKPPASPPSALASQRATSSTSQSQRAVLPSSSSPNTGQRFPVR